MLFIPWEWIAAVRPTVRFQIRNDVLPRRFCGLVTPEFPHFGYACEVMAQLAVSHSVGWFACKFIQPQVNLIIGLPEEGSRFFAVLFKRGHTLVAKYHIQSEAKSDLPLERLRFGTGRRITVQ